PTTNGCECATIDIAVVVPFQCDGHGQWPCNGRYQSGSVITSEQHCDESRRRFSADNLLIKLPRWTGTVPANQYLLNGQFAGMTIPWMSVCWSVTKGRYCKASTHPASQSQTSHFQVSQ